MATNRTRDYGKNTRRYAEGGSILPVGFESFKNLDEDDPPPGDPLGDREMEKQPADTIGEDKTIMPAEQLSGQRNPQNNPDFRKRKRKAQET